MAREPSKKPILITGSHRSGSTWLAKMFELAGGTLVAQEPFNIQPWAYALDGLAEYWFTYAPALPQDPARRAFEKVLRRRTGRVFTRRQPQRYLPFTRRGRLIVKDPIACLSSEWLAENFDLEVIVLVRHPAGFAASLKRLGWTFPFEHFLRQERLMEEQLAPYRREIEERPEDIVSQAARLWKCLYGVLFEYASRNPSWIVRTHEELSLNPLGELEKLYGLLGLSWSPSAKTGIIEYTKADNPTSAPDEVVHQMRRDSASAIYNWKEQLTGEEIRHIHRETHELAARFYPLGEW
jgi:Sulfotransferase family